MAIRWPTAADLMTSDPVTVTHDAPLSEALGLMRTREIHELPVMRGRRLVGLLTFETIARRANLPLSTKAEHLLVLPPLVTPTATLPDIAEQLLAAGVRGAPVVGKRGELLGIVSRTDLVRSLAGLLASTRQPVDEVARSVGATIRDTDPVRTVLARVRLLEEHPLPVVDRQGHLVGAVGIADLGRILWRPTVGGKRDAARPGSVGDVEVRTIMHSPAVTVEEGTTIAEAARRMTRERVSSVFVLDPQGRPISILSQTDILGLVVTSRGAEGAALGDVYVEITGLRGASDPAILTEIDRAVAKGLRRISRYVKPLLLNLHFAPHATHRGGDVTIEARLHTNHGIYYASNSGWNFLLGTTGLMDELLAQVRRKREEAHHGRRNARAQRAEGAGETIQVDGDLEDRIREATRGRTEE